MHVSWEVVHTWEEWKDFFLYLQYQFLEKMDSLPPFPKAHLLLTSLLIDERIRGFNRNEQRRPVTSRFVQGLIKDPEIMKASEVNKFFRITTHIRKEKCATLCMVRGLNDVRVVRAAQR